MCLGNDGDKSFLKERDDAAAATAADKWMSDIGTSGRDDKLLEEPLNTTPAELARDKLLVLLDMLEPARKSPPNDNFIEAIYVIQMKIISNLI